MQVITFLNEKGGVGKTTLATTMAAAYAIKGANVLLVDADGQGHASIAFGGQKEPCFYDLLKRNADWKDVLRTVAPEQYAPNAQSQGSLTLLPGNDETRHIASAISDATLLRRRIKQMSNVFDVVVFDTSPTPSLLHSTIMMTTDAIVYPTKLETWALDGVRESMWHVQGINDYFEENNIRSAVKSGGIVPTMTELGTLEHAANLELLNSKFDMVLRPIAKRTAWREATTAGMSIFAYVGEGQETSIAWATWEAIHARTA